MKNDPNKLLRYTPFERINHWLTAIFFILTALTGLSFFQPLYYPLTLWFGGGVWARILHPFFGVVTVVSFGVLFSEFRPFVTMTPSDREWLRHIREMAAGDERNMPEAGKFNGGQKVLVWLLVACTVLLILSGIVIWRAYFSFLFPLWLIRLASVIHAASGAVMIALIIFHIYAGIWVRESIDAMLYGRVRCGWAKQHHTAWYREMTGGSK